MTTNHFRTAAIVLIAFNLVGTVVTWTAHLAKPGTSAAHAIMQGTQFTGPLVFVAAWIACVATLWAGRRAATVGTWLMTLFALGFGVGEASELVQKNIGVSSAKWDAILVLSVVGLVLALSVVVLGALRLTRGRRMATA